MQQYSPFSIPLRDLAAADLPALKQTAEGWYIEYKRETPNASAIAKSISAFANTYGGWLFIGVDEVSKEIPVAGSFPGIAQDEADATLQKIRKAAVDHLNPTPHFDTKIIYGPNQELGLAADRVVICVWTPQSTLAPHVHKSGSIYRRVSDASEPKAENDRFILDQLWRRGDEMKRRHKDWYEMDPEFSKRESELPYIRLMLIADPWAQRDIWIDAEENEIREALGGNLGSATIHFDSVYTYSNGYIGRQLAGNNPHNLTLTWRLRHSLISDVLIPLPLYDVDDVEHLSIELDGYKHVEQFTNLLRKHGASSPRVVDLNYVLNVLIGVAETQERLCNLARWNENYFFKVKLLNSWRTIPYIDAPQVLDRLEINGLSMCLDKTSSVPHGLSPDSYIQITRRPDIQERATRNLIEGAAMFGALARAYGLPMWLPDDEKGMPYHDALWNAGRRGLEAQRLRNLREKR
ncbi:ATP-binding protein [Rhodoferax saidenbachensis]|nr:ATP-binding protein [Rhodoferax saidenbachensis]